MGGKFVLAIDQGTTGTTVLVVDETGAVRGRGYREITQRYPQPGWVEHDPLEIWHQSLSAAREAMNRAQVTGTNLRAIGITNQRETTILWDATTSAPVAPAIVWQCRRTAPLCDSLRAAGLEPDFTSRTGLVLDAYFSGTKIRWLLDNIPNLRQRAERGELRFGTVDSWLVWNLTGGRSHLTDHTNASRTLLYNIYTLRWDEHLLQLLDIPASLLPVVVTSSGIAAETVGCLLDGDVVIPAGIPIAGLAGDQHAALFGQACYAPGMVKCTYGTGAFLVMNTGPTPIRSSTGLLTTIAWGLPTGVEYALEGSIFIAGAAIQWLRDELQIIQNAAETEEIAVSVPDTAGAYFVPAFVGLGAPYWDMYARGTLVGLTRGTNRRHIVRAALESIAYQTRDVVDAMAADAGRPAAELRIDGGAAANSFLAQFQADILGAPVVRPQITETTALGAAYLAGLGAGIWSSRETLAQLWQPERRFSPTMSPERRENLYHSWRRAVERARHWTQPTPGEERR